MDVKQIEQLRVSLEKEVAALSKKLESLGTELGKRRTQLDLVKKLLASESSEDVPQRHTVLELPGRSSDPRPTPDEVRERAMEILVEANRPMNIKEIHAEFIRRGLSIPGKGTPFNILVHMAREVKKGRGSRFYRTAKGTYSARPKSDIPLNAERG